MIATEEKSVDRLDRESAEGEFNRFVDEMELGVDSADMDEEDKKDFVREKDRLVKAIQKGSLVINENGEPVYTPQRSENKNPLTFHEPTGASLIAMDRKKKGADAGKLYATMADMTRVDAKVFSKMKYRDLQVCTAVTTLFLG